jgi:hypothetical protein
MLDPSDEQQGQTQCPTTNTIRVDLTTASYKSVEKYKSKQTPPSTPKHTVKIPAPLIPYPNPQHIGCLKPTPNYYPGAYGQRICSQEVY